MMGGRAAEELVFGIKSTGGQSDIQQATELATSMVCKWGMSEGLGPQVYMIDDGDFLGSTNHRLAMSIRTENQVDKEIRNLLDECYSEAVAILSNERLFLSVLADILMQVETVDGEEFVIVTKPMNKGIVIGGVAFGLGWAITGACPGPIYAQIGSGTFLAIVTLLAALTGAYIFALLQPRLPF